MLRLLLARGGRATRVAAARADREAGALGALAPGRARRDHRVPPRARHAGLGAHRGREGALRRRAGAARLVARLEICRRLTVQPGSLSRCAVRRRRDAPRLVPTRNRTSARPPSPLSRDHPHPFEQPERYQAERVGRARLTSLSRVARPWFPPSPLSRPRDVRPHDVHRRVVVANARGSGFCRRTSSRARSRTC